MLPWDLGDSASKLFTMRRNLLLPIKEFINFPDCKSNDNFEIDAMQFGLVQQLHDKLCKGVSLNLLMFCSTYTQMINQNSPIPQTSYTLTTYP